MESRLQVIGYIREYFDEYKKLNSFERKGNNGFQDHERIRGGLYFIQAIPRDENWKVRRDLLVDYKPRTTEEVLF